MRFTLRRILSNLWEIHDAWTDLTEFVLFGVRSSETVRLWATRECLSRFDGRGEALRELARIADRSGMIYDFRPPPPMTLETYHVPAP